MRKFSIKTAVSAGAIFLGIIATVPAHATTFDFSVSSIGVPGDIASGTFTGNETSSGIYTLTGITGTFDGVNITGLTGYANADNELFYPSQPFVDFNGISFQTASLGAINLFSNSGYFEVKSTVDSVGYYFSGTPISLAVSATPLPSTWTMMLIGLAGFGFVAYRRKAKPEFMAT
jgi:PEP-CTERM motif